VVRVGGPVLLGRLRDAVRASYTTSDLAKLADDLEFATDL
jgi:hypothetical protein